MPFKKGQSGNPRGRKAGTPNKTTAVVKEGILHAYTTIGGDRQFAAWAKANPGEFYTKVLTKILPAEMQLSGVEDGAPITARVLFEVIRK